MLTDNPAFGETRPPSLSADDLLALARASGADDAGLVSIDDPAIADERPHILAAFPAARTLIALVLRMGKAAGLNAVYHFVFTGPEACEATMTIRDRRLEVREGRHGAAHLTVTADGRPG